MESIIDQLLWYFCLDEDIPTIYAAENLFIALGFLSLDIQVSDRPLFDVHGREDRKKFKEWLHVLWMQAILSINELSKLRI